jgi:hypothetical protein
MATVPSTQTETLDSRNEEECSGIVQDAKRLDSLLTIMSNKCWKLISFHFPTILSVFWLCKFFLSGSPNWNFFHLIFNFAYLLQRAIVLPIIYFWKNTWSFLVVWVILCLSIKGFVVRNCRFFHTFEKNIIATVKNWWSLTYGQVHNISFILKTCPCCPSYRICLFSLCCVTSQFFNKWYSYLPSSSRRVAFVKQDNLVLPGNIV